jgi:hypothetical protein
MFATCRKSNIEFRIDAFSKYITVAEHPLFSTSFNTLLDIYDDWKKGQLSANESRVLFLALLDRTGLLIWNDGITAIPDRDLVAKNMEQVAVVATWKHAIGNRISLPFYSINHDTRRMLNIHNMIKTWNEIHKEFSYGSHMQASRERIEKAQDRIKKLLTADREDTPAFRKRLAEWFFVAAAVPEPKQSRWLQLFTMENITASCTPSWEFEEIIDHYHDKIRNQNGFSMYCYRHLESQRKLSMDGLMGLFSGGESKYTILDPNRDKSAEVKPQQITFFPDESKEEKVNKEAIIALAPESEPQPSDYNNRVEYLVASARWKLKVKMEKEEMDALDKLTAPEQSTTPDQSIDQSTAQPNQE